MNPVVVSTPNPLACRMASVVRSIQSSTFRSPSYVGADSYPLYKRSSPDDGGQVSIISMRVGGAHIDQQVDNRWIVSYNKLLLRSINCHCNVELCMSIKSIKYVL